VSRFAQQAEQLLEAAEAASARGETCSDLTVLLGHDGSIRMIAESDWPLDSLVRDQGARAAYRVTARRGSICVEGRDGRRSCVLESAGRARPAIWTGRLG
jgi:hypothetical protein